MSYSSSDDDMPLARPNGNGMCIFVPCIHPIWTFFYCPTRFATRRQILPWPPSSARSVLFSTDAPTNQHSRLVSAAKVTASMDKALDRSVPKSSGGGEGLLVRRNNADAMALDGPLSNKRKSRTSITKIDYKVDSDSDGAPLVSC